MKTVRHTALGLVVAAVGVLVSDICGDLFNGMDYGSACAVGMGAYLCVVVIVCAGIVVSKLEERGRPAGDGTQPEQGGSRPAGKR